VYRTVVVGTDGSATAATAVHHAVRLAVSCRAGLHVVTAFARVPGPVLAHAGLAPPVPLDDGSWIAPLHDRFVEEGRRAGVEVRSHVVDGQPATVLIEVARRVGADLLVTGNRGVSGLRGLLGSVPKALVAHAPCPVLVVPTDRVGADA
jgi:nucleotide-binding universal stress UspA family protein